jgi:hypothetical protein
MAEANDKLSPLFHTLIDAFTFLAAGMKEMNVKRRELLKPDLNASYKLLCAPTVPMTAELFGDDLSTQVKDITEANKTARSISRGTRGGRGRFPRYRGGYTRRPFLGRGGRGSRGNYSSYSRGQGAYGGSYGQSRRGRGRGLNTQSHSQSQSAGNST